jgi:hypothetical protein
MTIEDNHVPSESVPDQQPRKPRRYWTKSAGLLVVATPVGVVALAGLSAVGIYLSRDRTASSPGPQTVTITPTHKAPSPTDGPDGVFLSALAAYGISDNGTDAVSQRFMEFGHHACFSLLPPEAQPLDAIVDNILSAENQDVAGGSRVAPKFTHDDAENLAQAAISAYCPDASE